jgi:LGFP repeat-containing protein
MRPPHLLLAGFFLAAPACATGPQDEASPHSDLPADTVESYVVNRTARYTVIRNSAAARGIRNAYLFAGIANTETNLAQCWSEATWACQGPSSPDCGGGPVIAGAADGPCSAQQGGLGMFQFDAGTFGDTLRVYGSSVLTVDGQIGSAIAYVTNMVKISAYTTNAETDAKALAWINNFDPNNATLRDQWIKTVLRYYNGCQPTWSCWSPRYQTYTDGYNLAIDEPGGLGFWAATGTSCNGSPVTVGRIDEKYRALGGCSSFLGAPTTPELGTPDGIGRYSVFQNGSIYWSPSTGAFEVHGLVRDRWAQLGWEAGFVGYPLTDETPTPDGAGRYNVFQGASIYWSPSTGAHEVHGWIRDKWRDLGWEAGVLGYPTSDEYSVAEGRRSDFQHGSILFHAQDGTVTVQTTP